MHIPTPTHDEPTPVANTVPTPKSHTAIHSVLDSCQEASADELRREEALRSSSLRVK